MTKKIKGFTLIELLVVMSIIAFLLLASLAGLTYGLKKARDTSRERAVATLQTALLAYYNDNLAFPIASDTGMQCSGSYGTNGNMSKCDITAMVGLNANGTMPQSGNSSSILSTYFEEGFRSPIAISGTKDLDNAMAYYVNADGTQYAVCALTELASSGNTTITDANLTGHGWGCYCDGPAGADVACAGLTNPTGAQ